MYKSPNIINSITQPFYESRLHWLPDPTPPSPHRAGMDYSDPPVFSPSDSVRSRDIPVKIPETSVTQASAIAVSAA